LNKPKIALDWARARSDQVNPPTSESSQVDPSIGRVEV